MTLLKAIEILRDRNVIHPPAEELQTAEQNPLKRHEALSAIRSIVTRQGYFDKKAGPHLKLEDWKAVEKVSYAILENGRLPEDADGVLNALEVLFK